MTLNRVLLGALMASAILSGYAQADDQSVVNRNNGQVGFSQSFFDEDLDMVGYRLQASKTINDNIYVIGGYEELSDLTDVFFDELEVTHETLYLGAGYDHLLTNNLVIFGEVVFVNTDVTAGMNSFSESTSESGYKAAVGLVYRINETWQLSAHVKQQDVFASETGFGGEVVYHFNDLVSTVYSWTSYEDRDNSQLSVRFSF